MSANPYQIEAGYAALLVEIEPLLFLARDSGLQQAGIGRVEAFLKKVEFSRITAIQAQEERNANALLGLAMVVAALGSELNVYLLLKSDQPEAAWNNLIDAQEQTLAAGRATDALTNLQAKFEHLRTLEDHLFPPQTFVSSGLIAGRQLCSICRADYAACDHLVGRAYMGRFCSLSLEDIRLDHIALVEQPADRRCRVVTMKVDGVTRNKMTWLPAPAGADKKGNSEAILALASPRYLYPED